MSGRSCKVAGSSQFALRVAFATRSRVRVGPCPPLLHDSGPFARGAGGDASFGSRASGHAGVPRTVGRAGSCVMAFAHSRLPRASLLVASGFRFRVIAMHHIPCPHDRSSFASLVHILGSLQLHSSVEPLRANGVRSAIQLENTPKPQLRLWIGDPAIDRLFNRAVVRAQSRAEAPVVHPYHRGSRQAVGRSTRRRGPR